MPASTALTSRISLLALGEVFSRNTLMATGIFTLSPSGIQMPYGGSVSEEDTDGATPLTVPPTPHLIDSAESAGAQNLHFLQLRLLEDAHLRLVGEGPAGCQRLHQL